MNWYLATQDIDSTVRSSNQIDVPTVKQFVTQYYDNLWFAHHNLYETYNTPAGQLAVDGVLMLTMPALALGRRAKKVIEITRHLAEYID